MDPIFLELLSTPNFPSVLFLPSLYGADESHCSTAFPSLSVEAVLGWSENKKSSRRKPDSLQQRAECKHHTAHRKVHCKLSPTAVSPFCLTDMNSSVRVVPFTFLLLLFLPTFLLHCAIPGICRDKLVHLTRTVRK